MRGYVNSFSIAILLAASAALAETDAPPPAPASGDAKPAPEMKLPGNLNAPPKALQAPKTARPMVQAPAPPPLPGEKPRITNYFKHMREKLGEEAKKPLPPKRQTTQLMTPPRDYPFDAIDGLTSQDLMRAVKEGVREARQELYGHPQEEIDRMAEANIRFVLEYYPIVAIDANAFNNLYYVLEDPHADPMFRRILFTLSMPEHYTDTLFSRYLQEGLRLDMDRLFRMYGKIILDDQDSPLIRQLTMQNMYGIRYDEFCKVLAKDANAAAFRDANGRMPVPKDLAGTPSPFTPSAGIKVGLRKSLEAMENLANLFGGLIKPTSTSPQELRDAVIVQLKRMQEEIPFEDPKLVENLLAQAAPASESAKPAAPKKTEEELSF